jgi:hypothetical protein
MKLNLNIDINSRKVLVHVPDLVGKFKIQKS